MSKYGRDRQVFTSIVLVLFSKINHNKELKSPLKRSFPNCECRSCTSRPEWWRCACCPAATTVRCFKWKFKGRSSEWRPAVAPSAVPWPFATSATKLRPYFSTAATYAPFVSEINSQCIFFFVSLTTDRWMVGSQSDPSKKWKRIAKLPRKSFAMLLNPYMVLISNDIGSFETIFNWRVRKSNMIYCEFHYVDGSSK